MWSGLSIAARLSIKLRLQVFSHVAGTGRLICDGRLTLLFYYNLVIVEFILHLLVFLFDLLLERAQVQPEIVQSLEILALHVVDLRIFFLFGINFGVHNIFEAADLLGEFEDERG